MRKGLFILYGLLFSFAATAQRNNMWYFGKQAGISFATGQPVSLLNSVIDAEEGSATICDLNGDLLFYTNGKVIYNRKHQPMLNGDGLMGNTSGVQTVVIVPKPGNKYLYYVFTTDALENGFANGYRYSVVDMRGDNGDGAVVQKNTLLFPSCTERMTAVRHADGTSVWLITNDYASKTFRSWLIDCSGISTTPVLSSTGVFLDEYNLQNVGMLKGSADGKLICQAIYPYIDEAMSRTNYAQLFDFDNATGRLTNPRQLSVAGAQLTNCEFSPDGRYLYLLRSYQKKLEQFDITLPTAAQMNASHVTINTNSQFFGIQLAPDGKIYLARRSNWLGSINKPNLKAPTCDFVEQQFQLENGSGYTGLPSSINDLSYDPLNGFMSIITDSCTGTIQFSGVTAIPGNIKWLWDFGDGQTGVGQNQSHTFTPPNAEYTVTLMIVSDLGCDTVRFSRKVRPNGLLSKPDYDFKASCDSNFVRFTNKNPALTIPGSYWRWDFGDGQFSNETSPVHRYLNAGQFTAKLKLVTNKACLSDSISKTVTMEPLPVTISADQTIFLGQKIQLFVTGNGGATYNWYPPAGLTNTTVQRPQASPRQDIVYKGSVTNANGCSGIDSVKITVVDLDGVYVPTAFTPNNDGRNDQIRPLLGSRFTLKEFSIYNRWGEKVYTTRTKEEGWSGKINGVEQNPGVYVWILKFLNDKGEPVERKGTVILLR